MHLESKVEEITYEVQMLRERESAREKLLGTLEEKARKYEEQINEDTSIHIQSQEEYNKMKVENEQLKNDMSWLANQAKQSKMQTDKAIADL